MWYKISLLPQDLNTIPAFLPTGISNGHDGTTFIRIRLCSAANQCTAPTGTVDNGEVEDYTVNVLQQMSISGIVFEDNGVGGATDAHDGIQDGTERGLANFKVQAIYNGPNIAGYNTGDIIATQLTGSDGRYTFEIPVVLAG
ncbi:GEVED domain-containing protein, partial [Photobacterium leiognathi]|uniref:GEVED domain-containing protein n=1 Tax=Photobacterium leiognathi TaxID=553611 RepID=UPI0027374D3B